MSLTSLSTVQANKQSDKKAFLRIVPEEEDPSVLPHENVFRPTPVPTAFLVGPFLALSFGIIALAVAVSWYVTSRSSTDDSQWILALLPVAVAIVVLALAFFMRKPSNQPNKQEFLDAYRTARASTRPVPAQALKIWTNVAEGSLLIYVALLQLPTGELLVSHNTGGAQPFEAPTKDATFYVWELPHGWKVVQVAKRTA